METTRLVLDVGLVLGLAAITGWGARRLGLPAVVGYLAAGLAVSPFTPGYVADRHQIELFAEVGVVLLLFEVGIEVDVARLRREHRPLLWAVPLQMVLTTAIGAAVFAAVGLSPFACLLLGLSVAMSSSVVVVNITRSRRRTTDPATERTLVGWSVMQDVTGVALAAGILAGFGASDRTFPVALVSIVLYAALAFLAARLLPAILDRIIDQHDIFLLLSVATGLVAAGIGALVFGIPMALAAFVAGLVIAENPQTSEVRQRLGPFRDVFATLFFVSIGSLIDPAILPAALPWGAAVIVLVVAVKCLPVYVLVRVARIPARAGQVAIGLGQVGEFSFVLASIGLAVGAVAPEVFAGLMAALVTTIAGSAVIVRAAGRREAVPD